jgi:hypothetical protein
VAAVYTLVPNATIHFTFMDYHYTQVNFNNYFIEKYKEKYPEAYSYYSKVFKPRLYQDTSGAIMEKESMKLNDDELSSDDEDKRKVFKPVKFEEFKEKMLTLFDE